MKKLTYILASLFITTICSFGQVDRTKPPQPGPAPKIQIGACTKYELSNGLKVFVVENHRLPKVSFSISFIFDPSLEAPNEGIGSLTSDLIGTGTTTRTKDQINEEVDFIGATLNASATGIFASSLKKHTAKLLDILSDVAQNSVFNKEELERKRTQFLSGLASEKDDANAIAGNVSAALIFGKNFPYGEFETEASVKNITLDMCNNYYQTYFRPNIACLSIVGDITPKEAKVLAEKYFSNWKKRDLKTPVYPKPQSPQKNIVALVDRPQSVQSVINIGYPIDMNLGNPDYIKTSVTNTVLGGGVFRLFLNLREKHAYTYGAYSSINSYPLMGSFKASTSARNAVTDSAITQILFEMKRIREEPVPATELSMVKNYITGNFALSLENPQTIASFAVNTERYKLPKDFYANYLKNIEAVNSNDVQQMAQKYILPDKAYILVVGKASEIADKLKQFSTDGKVNYYDSDANAYDPAMKSKPAPAGTTARDVLDKYIQAEGGEKNIEKLQDLTMTGSMEVQGMPLKINIMHKIPGKFLMDVIMNGQSVQKITLNGEAGKSSGMQGDHVLTGTELEKIKLQADPFPENKYDKLGYKAVLKGTEIIDGKEAYVIEITSPSNAVSTDYYSTQTGLKIRSVTTMDSPMGTVTQTSDILDYIPVNGIMFPKKIQQTVGPQTFDITIDSVIINSGLKDEIFQ